MINRFFSWCLRRFGYVRELESRARRAEFALERWGRQIRRRPVSGTAATVRQEAEDVEAELRATLIGLSPPGLTWHMSTLDWQRERRADVMRIEIELRLERRFHLVGGRRG